MDSITNFSNKSRECSKWRARLLEVQTNKNVSVIIYVPNYILQALPTENAIV